MWDVIALFFLVGQYIIFLATVPTRRSISMELEDVEARDEQYHMTHAFLKLTASLLDANNLVK